MIPDSATITTNKVPSAPHEHPWDVVGPIPEKAAIWQYGYVINGQAVSSTPEDLVRIIESRGAEIQFVWTPETPTAVLPERVPFLVEGFRRSQAKGARNNMLVGGAIAGVGLLVAIGLREWEFVYRGLLVVIGAMFLVEGIWSYWRSRNYTQEDAMSDASTARFASWLKSKGLSGYTITLAACIIVVGVVQVLNPDWLKVAALVKPSVREGEIWRLFSATLMHANFTHFWLNFFGLLHFSRIIEQTLHRAYVPLVFLITGALGSIFSVVLYPNTNSVGASGGLMGLLGFILIGAYFNRTKYPPKYFRQLIRIIVLVGVLGLFGFAFIDNAAHCGGLGGGLALGWLFLRGTRKEKTLQIAGVASALALGLTAAIAIHRLLR